MMLPGEAQTAASPFWSAGDPSCRFWTGYQCSSQLFPLVVCMSEG
jgi:hypothetical protein